MKELIERIGIPLFIEIVIELWNSVFLLIMIFSLQIMKRYNNGKVTDYDSIPYSTEISVFYSTIFIYNLINVASIVTMGGTDPVSYWVMRIGVFLYYATGAFLTLFFLQLLKKYVAQKNGLKRLETAVTALQLMHFLALGLLAVTPFTEAIYYIDEINTYHR